jgi:hypothetical protein
LLEFDLYSRYLFSLLRFLLSFAELSIFSLWSTLLESMMLLFRRDVMNVSSMGRSLDRVPNSVLLKSLVSSILLSQG